MLNALRASVMILVLVGTAHAGESLNPPAPQPPIPVQEPTCRKMLYAETEAPGVSDNLVSEMLELLAILPALL